jgi:hypothetical protein
MLLRQAQDKLHKLRLTATKTIESKAWAFEKVSIIQNHSKSIILLNLFLYEPV